MHRSVELAAHLTELHRKCGDQPSFFISYVHQILEQSAWKSSSSSRNADVDWTGGLRGSHAGGVTELRPVLSVRQSFIHRQTPTTGSTLHKRTAQLQALVNEHLAWLIHCPVFWTGPAGSSLGFWAWHRIVSHSHCCEKKVSAGSGPHTLTPKPPFRVVLLPAPSIRTRTPATMAAEIPEIQAKMQSLSEEFQKLQQGEMNQDPRREHSC